MRIYIAGPMTGLPDFNYPAFHQAAKLLETKGYDPINPARNEGREGVTQWIDFMRASLRDIADCDGIALLPGWETSKGAFLERDLARDLGFPVMTLEEWVA